MNTTPNTTTPTVDPAIAAFFQDPNASSIVVTNAMQIAAPVVRGEALKMEELAMGGGLRICVFALDRSKSMGPVADLVLKEFNTDFVPAIKAAREDDISALRIGGVSFATDITPIWEGDDGGEPIYFHSLESLPDLTYDEYNTEEGWSTNFDETIEDCVARGLAYAAAEQAKIGSAPDLDIILMTDGRDNHRGDHSAVKQMIESRHKGRVRFICFFFETDWGLENPKEELVELYGFDPENVIVFEQGQNETKEERAHRFRAMMRVMSRVSASKGTSAVQAAAAVQATASVDDDDDDDDLV